MNETAIWIFAALILAVVLGVAVFIVVATLRRARQRSHELGLLAAKLGLTFNPDTDKMLPDHFSFLNKLGKGSGRFASNILAGRYQHRSVLIFDYHYQISSGEGTRQVSLSFFILFVPHRFPELTIAPKGMLAKIGSALGFEDIRFESAEFSEAFCVRSKDKRLAYDICNPRMMEYLLGNRDLNIEIERDVLAIGFDRELSATQIRRNLARLLAIRSFIPEHLFNKI
jgi:hypothetical protein